MTETVVLSISVGIQFAAAFLALRLIRVTGWRAAWLLIAMAVFLMAVRRSITLFHVLAEDVQHPLDLVAECVALVISLLMLAGIACAGQLFGSIRRTQEELRQSETKYRAMFESTSDGIAVYRAVGAGEDFVFVDLNPAAESIEKVSKSTLIGRSVLDVFPGVRQFGLFDVFQRVYRTGIPEQHPLGFYRDERLAGWRENFVYRLPSGEIVAVYTDETERKLAEEALRQSEANYRTIFDSANDAIFVHDPDIGRILDVNQRMCQMYHCTADEAKQLTVDDLSSGVPPYAQADALRLIGKATRGEPQVFQWRAKDTQGRLFWAEVSLKAAVIGGRNRILAVVRDITERRRLEDQLRQAQKMEAVGRLAGGVAHDFNNQLTVIRGFCDLLLQDVPKGDPSRESLDEIRRAATRAAALTSQLLAFSRRQILRPEVINLAEVVTTMRNPLGRMIGEDVELSVVAAPDLGNVKADRGLVEQAVMNLVVNARDAMPDGGRLVIELANAELDAGYVAHHSDVVPGPYVMLAVSDTGIGMDEETRRHIFDPFFTTKEVGKGTGLGLAMVYGFVRQSRGTIYVYSEPGHGTSLKIYLPRVDEPALAVASAAGPTRAEHGEETILVAEDDEAVRQFMARVLRDHGYSVLDVARPDEALSLAERHDGNIHLLVSDVVMPQMQGPELADRLKSMRPEMRVLYVSGYTENAVADRGMLKPGVNLLTKPFTPDELARAVRRVLDAPTAGADTSPADS